MRFISNNNDNKYIINDKIKSEEIRLVDEQGTQIGIVGINFAKEKAFLAGLDLVLISPNANPPVCKIMDFGKFKYEINKKEKDAKKNVHQQLIKEVKLSPRIEEHDYDFKVNNAKIFLKKGSKVKFSILFRGREMQHPEIGEVLVQKIMTDLKDIAKADNEPRLIKNLITLVVSPLK